MSESSSKCLFFLPLFSGPFLTLLDKTLANKIFGGQKFSADIIFGTNSKFQQFCLAKTFYPFFLICFHGTEYIFKAGFDYTKINKSKKSDIDNLILIILQSDNT